MDMTESAPQLPEDQQSRLENGDSTALRTLCAQLHEKVNSFLNEDVKTERLRTTQAQTRRSLAVIQEALDRYELSSLSLSYNGGKDCLVLLILYLSVLSTHPQLPALLPSIYIPPLHPFPSVDAFVASSSSHYNLSLHRYPHPSMRIAFSSYLADNPHIRAIFVGTRRTDPHGADLTFFDETDRAWPKFMRVHPVIDWHYAEVWAFLRHLDVEYCELYDAGYTSLGGVGDTHPNPALRVEGEEGKFRPAYELVEDGEERLGRD
ncbi:MAG: hypothetical protein Q9195_007058 [Heterodermia aff. obscurata]